MVPPTVVVSDDSASDSVQASDSLYVGTAMSNASAVPSLLDHLRALQKSKLSRKQSSGT